ncbi:hypothetical protein ACN9MF_02090 [Methylobacterium fujisawaense]|uniref:hypothetical protein n=1 Tax=Methylobacterium fujisawaense TaxID=107400 RepID=UPI003CF20E6C
MRHDDAWWMNNKETWGKLTYPKDTNIYETPEERQIKSVMPPFGGDHEPRTQVAQAPIAIGSAAGTVESGIALSGAGAFLEAAPPVAAGTAAVIGIGGVGLGAGALTAIGHNALMTILAGPSISAPINPTLDELDQIYYNKQTQNLAAAQVKPASWVRVTSAHPCAVFACPPAKGPYGGGSYACIKNRQRSKPNGSRNTPHHTPSAAASYLPYSAGPVIEMSPSDHALTASYQNTATSILYIRGQTALIASGNLSASTMMDVVDINIKFPDGLYKDAVAQMVEYTACLKANGFVK